MYGFLNNICKTEQKNQKPNEKWHRDNIYSAKNKVDMHTARGKIKLRFERKLRDARVSNKLGGV